MNRSRAISTLSRFRLSVSLASGQNGGGGVCISQHCQSCACLGFYTRTCDVFLASQLPRLQPIFLPFFSIHSIVPDLVVAMGTERDVAVLFSSRFFFAFPVLFVGLKFCAFISKTPTFALSLYAVSLIRFMLFFLSFQKPKFSCRKNRSS